MNSKPVHITFMVGSLRMGGAERMMVSTANELTKHFQVSFLTLTGGDALAGELKKSIRLVPLNRKKSLSAFSAACKFLKTENPDVLISTQIHVNLIAILLKVICRIRSKMILREATSPGSHFELSRDFRSRLVKLSVKMLYPRADAIVAICESVKKDLLSNGFAKPSRVSVIYNPVVNDSLREGCKEIADHDFFHAGVPVLVSVGRLAPVKKISLLIRAFGILLKKMDARLLIIGDGPEKEKLVSLAGQHGLAGKIFFTGQMINPYPLLKKSSVYILSSLFEGLPNALIEAMACGIQLVSVDCPGGSREVLMNGALGKIVAMNDPEALAEGIMQALNEPVPVEKLAEGATRFNAEKISLDYRELIHRLIKE